jgi:hypothetical protein
LPAEDGAALAVVLDAAAAAAGAGVAAAGVVLAGASFASFLGSVEGAGESAVGGFILSE